MAFGAAEAEGFGVVADEHHAVAGVAWGGAEVALFDTHFEIVVFIIRLLVGGDCKIEVCLLRRFAAAI